MIHIKISSQFSDTPGARVRSDGPYSGEEFRQRFLEPAARSGDQVDVDLNDTEGYGPSFLEEAFGGLVRNGILSAADFRRRFRVLSDDEVYIEQINRYVENASQARAAESAH